MRQPARCIHTISSCPTRLPGALAWTFTVLRSRFSLSKRPPLTDTNVPVVSAIGHAFRKRPVAATLLAISIVSIDFAILHRFDEAARACVALVGFAIAVYLSEDDQKSLGLRASPVQGWLPWIGTSLRIGCVVAVCIIIGLSTWSITGHSLKLHVTEPSHIGSRLVHMCFVAPVLEESIYRISACGLIAAIVGQRTTIMINGVLFGALHVWYGNASPENLVGGFFLAWSFLKSETILVPFILHSGGNMLALAAQVSAWYMGIENV